MKKASLPELPKQIKVKLKKTRSGVFFAELSEYDVFTEADNPVQLFLNVNDLIYAFFDIPKKFQGKIFYAPQPPLKHVQKAHTSIPFHPLLTIKAIGKGYGDCISWS